MIKSDDFRRLDWSDRGGGEVIGFPELDALNALVDAFAAEMKAKLKAKFIEGYAGWDDPRWQPLIQQRLVEHVERGSGQYVDIANLVAMLWNIECDSSSRVESSSQ